MSIFHLLKHSLLTKTKCQYCNVNLKSFSYFLSNGKSSSRFTKIWDNINTKSNNSKTQSLSKLIYKFLNTKANVNVVKDVILYKYTNKNRTNIVVLFGLSQGFFWAFTTHTILTDLRDVPVNEEDKKKGFFDRHNFGEYKWKLPLGIVCFIMAVSSAAVSYFYLTRSVSSIRLDKSGKTIRILVAEDRWWKKEMILPLNNISAMYSRNEMKNYFPFQVKDKSLFYFIDLEEPITNVALFDVTVGTKRKLN